MIFFWAYLAFPVLKKRVPAGHLRSFSKLNSFEIVVVVSSCLLPSRGVDG